MSKRGQFIFCAGTTLTVLLATSCKSTNSGELAVKYDPQSAMALGRGYDQLTGRTMGDCMERSAAVSADINGAPSTSTSPAEQSLQLKPSQTVKSTLYLISSDAQKSRVMNTEAALAVRYLVSSGSASASYFNSKKSSDTSLTLLLVAEVTNGAQTMVDVVPKAVWADLAAKNAATFINKCGDSFFMSYTSGGRLWATIVVETNSKEEKDALATKLGFNVTYGLVNVQGGASFNMSTAEIIKKHKTSIQIEQSGGSGVTANPTATFEGLLDRWNKFAEIVAQNPVIYAMATVPYDSYVPELDTVVAGKFGSSVEAFKRMYSASLDIVDIITNIDVVLTNPKDYPSADLAKLKSDKEMLANKRQHLLEQAAACTDLDLTKRTPCEYNDPELKYELPTSDPNEVRELVSLSPKTIKADAVLINGGTNSDFGGSPIMKVRGEFVVSADKKNVQFLAVGNFDRNNVRAEAKSSVTIYTAKDGWKIKAIEGTTKYDALVDSYSKQGHNDDVKSTDLGDFTIRGDRKGKDVGVYTGFTGRLDGQIIVRVVKDAH